MEALLPLYLAVVSLLCVHGLHRLWLVALVRRTRDRAPVAPPLAGELPFVTVQLPVFNERDVVARLVDAVVDLDWPADRLQIQLLDDSTDDTADHAASALARARARGIAAEVRRRSDRVGYKAGALAAGLAGAKGELVAIFDADFVPTRDFLRRLVPHFADPGVGMVQARWGHLNADAGTLCDAQAVLLDGHFAIEHTARNRSGGWFNFNGTAGVWRRACVEAAGGWEHDTLTEDLDLSYRAQLAGWRFVYVLDHVVPAELPDGVAAFRGQQKRWAKGSIETARKLTGRILRSTAPVRVRFEALAHLWSNLAWPFALLLAAIFPAVVVVRGDDDWRHLAFDLPFFLLSTGANVLFYRAAGVRLARIPAALALGIGMAVNQTLAVFEALAGRRSAFVRTPKNGGGVGSYKAPASAPVPFELALATWHLGTAVYAIGAGLWGSVPFLLLFGLGFAWTGVGSLREMSAAPAAAAPQPVPGK
ncbi:MAG: glycosyltransferase [Myxococcota bacterium]